MKASLAESIELSQTVRLCEEELGDRGRILIRPSGTEPLIRIMLEGPDEKEILDYALSMARIVVKNHQGKIKA